MIIVVYSEVTESSIKTNLGAPAYSYYFVLKSFMPVLEQLGTVITVDNTEDVDRIYDRSLSDSEHCVFLSFTPPNDTIVTLRCPTIPVFAWEFYNIPDEIWDGDIRNDWRFVLGKLGWAITHSACTVKAVQSSMRADYPIVSVPAPVWDDYAPANSQSIGVLTDGFTLNVTGPSFDSADCNISEYMAEVQLTQAVQNNPRKMDIDGIVYTTILNPIDGRKNWAELMWSFCWAFREQKNTTLVIKLCINRPADILDTVSEISRATPFQCRVVVIAGYLEQESYDKLVNGTSFIVNASRAEGQCLPLMEYMSCGKPAIAPKHTGMEEYITEDAAFVVNSGLEPSHWPHDPRHTYKTLRHRIETDSLLKAYKDSFDVATNDPKKYSQMSFRATEILELHCSRKVVKARLAALFDKHREMTETYAQTNNKKEL